MSLPTPSDTPARPEEKDLFDRGSSDWIASPETAFDAWLAMQDYRRSSADVYRAQWGAFLTWLRTHQKNLATVDTASIAHFVGELPIRKTQRMRYLRLIERVLDHIRRTELASTNPARFIAQDGEATWRKARDNEPTGFLTPAERAKLLAYLFSPIGVSGSAYWKERRDRALVAVFLGAGVKTGEARVLTISCINTSGTSLQIPSTHPDFARETHLASFAIALLEAWLVERKRQEIPGELVFPASHAGRPMHKATMLRAIDAIVESAGLTSSRTARASPQTLRNTYAAELFEHDVAPERVGKWLGFVRPISSNRLHRAWKNWREALANGDPSDDDDTH
ncbi:tyrosine-type recombinase/integrase [Burkholderia sp. 22313]|uniref:tyrosine-type recombinase/integrase n=1 Tax=Burkholderia sp. 22313 TaxID=3453908 RepID=UPI003F839636